MTVKFVDRTTVQHIIRTNLLYPNMKGGLKVLMRNYKSGWMTQSLLMMSRNISISTTWKNPMKRHIRVGANTHINKAYGYMMVEERPEKYDIDYAAYNKYIGAAVTMEVPGEDPR